MTVMMMTATTADKVSLWLFFGDCYFNFKRRSDVLDFKRRSDVLEEWKISDNKPERGTCRTVFLYLLVHQRNKINLCFFSLRQTFLAQLSLVSIQYVFINCVIKRKSSRSHSQIFSFDFESNPAPCVELALYQRTYRLSTI